MKTIILLAVLAFAAVNAGVIPEAEEDLDIEKRFLLDTLTSFKTKLAELFKAGKANIKHYVSNIYNVSKSIFKKAFANVDFDDIVHKTINLIDSPMTETACSKLAQRAVSSVTGKDAGSDDSTNPAYLGVCKTALHYLEMFANYELKKFHKD